MRGGSGVVGSFFFLLPPYVAGGLVSGGCGVGKDRNRHGDSFLEGKDGRGTMSGGCKYHTRIANTILGSVSVAAT